MASEGVIVIGKHEWRAKVPTLAVVTGVGDIRYVFVSFEQGFLY